MVVGAIGIDGLAFEEAPGGGIEALAEATHNSAFLIRDGQVDPLRYDKIHLTPFGEVMPYISAWPWLERRLLDLGARGMSFDLDAGRRAERLEVPAGPGVAPWRPRELVGAAADAPAQTQAGSTLMIATPICFEVTSSVVCRRLVYEDGARAADLIVQLTNDGWFGASAGGRLTHLLTARWRAVELGVPLVRAANTGISAAVDARGRVFARTDASPGSPDPTDDGRLLVVDAELPPPGAPTPFARIGNLVGWASVLGSAATLVVAGFIGRVESRAASEAWMRPAEGGKDQRPGTERLRAARRGPGAGVERPRGGGDAPPAPDAPEDGA
jgi:apolipoprotein N-acyltransferase